MYEAQPATVGHCRPSKHTKQLGHLEPPASMITDLQTFGDCASKRFISDYV